jgi:hypothetical protein
MYPAPYHPLNAGLWCHDAKHIDTSMTRLIIAIKYASLSITALSIKAPQDCILYTSFTLKLMNGPNNLKCYITHCWKDWPGTNNLAYWAHS